MSRRQRTSAPDLLERATVPPTGAQNSEGVCMSVAAPSVAPPLTAPETAPTVPDTDTGWEPNFSPGQKPKVSPDPQN